ncbi:hypothetical protein COB21_03245 [Candidatus Aerophobetes bacterium]|uniref:CBS domain-containing protein n=1 Tax=Aerophobetes bacterium TaxID=2030807 RepID=A0A2A4X455_UNCAE|nr:MAG: hypothetical protein COB21_03245 [Candidatus Aerophobetes bacterium]
MVYQERSEVLKNCVTKTNATVLIDQTIAQALVTLQKKNIQKPFLYIYVVQEGYLKGVLPMRQLILANPESSVESVMKRSVISMKEDETLGEAIDILEQNKLLAVPVTSDKGYFLGIIDFELHIEHKIDVDQAHQKTNIFQMIGYHLNQKKQTGTFQNFSLRMPWIFGNMIGGLFCALISQFYTDVLSKMIVLAFFIPLVLTLSESVSTQSLAETLFLLDQKGRKKGILKSRIFKELRVLLLLAVTSAVVTGIISLFFEMGNTSGATILTPIIITTSISISIFCSGIVGTLIPFVLQKMKKDPKVAGGPLTLMFADIISTFIYLSTGYMVLF